MKNAASNKLFSRSQSHSLTVGVRRLFSIASSLALAATGGAAAPTEAVEPDFAAMSLDQLGSIKVTSVSKKEEKLSEASSAVAVITAEEIQRSGAQSLPEALRLAPGVTVAQVDAMQWAVSVRGFNDTFAQKLLVLNDGRSIYSPLFSGTFWQAQDVMMEDLDRIEVIRGPGGTVWGANAVNGVISIVTKSARETQGTLLTGGGGNDHLGAAGFRHGAQVADDVWLRVYGKYDHWTESRRVGGGAANDEWWKAQGGFRLDWEPSQTDRMTLQGDLFGLNGDQDFPDITLPALFVPPPAGGYRAIQPGHMGQEGGNTLGRWTHQFSEDSELSVQTYYDRSNLHLALLTEQRDTGDLDVRHRFQIGERNEVVWGGGYRLSDSRLKDSLELSANRKSRTDSICNIFLQDEIRLVPDRLKRTLGTKIEHNDYTGVEVEPGTRLAWTPTGKQTVWASVARAVRTPSQLEQDGTFRLSVLPANPPAIPIPAVISANGNSGFGSEELLAYEVGYRIQPHERLTFDGALFVNDYDNLRGSADRVDLTAVPNYAQVQSMIDNSIHGLTYGGELATVWQTTDWWRLQGQVSLIEADLHAPPNALTGATVTPSISSPKYQLSLRSSMDLGKQVTFDAVVRYVDRVADASVPIPGAPGPGYDIPAYATFDLRLAWHPCRQLEISLTGQNLAGYHREFVPTFITTQFPEVGPSVFAKLSYKF